MAESWRDALPEDLKAEPMFKDIPDVTTLAKVARDAKSALGTAIRVPGPQAGAEDWAAFRGKLKEKVPDLVEIPKEAEKLQALEAEVFERFGRPKDAKEYAEKIEGLDDQTLDVLRREALEEGLTKKQFESRAKRAVEQISKLTQAEKDDLAALKKEFGEAYQDRVAAAKAVAEKLGVPRDALDGMPARQLRVFANAAKAIGSDGREVGFQKDGTRTRMTPAEHAERAREIRTRLRNDNRMDGDTRAGLLKQLVDHETVVAESERS